MRSGAIQSRIVNRLRLAGGAAVRHTDLIQAMYPEPESEPNCPKGALDGSISALRGKGFNIVSLWGFGYRMI